MPLTAGIVGLPNVGKSTLFNAITKSQVEAANYPFATIQPNVGVVEVPDARVDRLVELFHPKKTIYTTFEFTDIAGLVKGASKGEGLGNQFFREIEVEITCFHGFFHHFLFQGRFWDGSRKFSYNKLILNKLLC